MLQRNVSGGVLLLTTLDPPVEVPPGGELDHPDPLAGFIPVEDPSPPVPPATPVPARPSKTPADPAAPATSEGATK